MAAMQTEILEQLQHDAAKPRDQRSASVLIHAYVKSGYVEEVKLSRISSIAQIILKLDIRWK
jgi:hypothetical protein